MLDRGLSGMGEQNLRQADRQAGGGRSGSPVASSQGKARAGCRAPGQPQHPFPQLLLGEVHENRSKRLVGTKRT